MDKQHGRGVERWTDGDVFEGEFKRGKKEGQGTYYHSGGEADVGMFRADQLVGDAVRWSADRQTSWRLLDGKVQEEISLAAARARSSLSEDSEPPPPSPRLSSRDNTAVKEWRNRLRDFPGPST